MKKLLLSVIVASGFSALGQSQMLDTVVVSASRFNTSLQSANRNVIIIKGEEVSNAPVQTVAELLDFATGVDARQRGIFGTQTDLSIRGGTYEQVLVLINGIRIGDPQTGHHLMNLPIQKSDIERIEILLGGGSYIFGGSAFSGAINIITKDATANNTEVNLKYGSFNTYQAGLTQTLAGDNHQTSLSVNTTASDGFKPNTDFNHTNLFGNSTIQAGTYDLNIAGGYTWPGFGAHNFYSTNFPEQYEKTRTLFANIGLKSEGRIKVDRQLYWRRNWDEFQLYREEGDDFYNYSNGLFIKGNDTAASWYRGHNYHRSDVLGGKVEAMFESAFGKTSVVAEYRHERVVSNNLGESLEAQIDIQGSRGAYNLGADRNNVSVAMEQARKLGRFDLSAALLLNYNSAYTTDWYPAVTIGYRISNRQKLYGSFNKSFRLPSYTDLYYNLGGAIGSKNLKPEESYNYELGYKYVGNSFFGNVSVFRREGSNIIDWVSFCDTCDLLASNISEVNFNGVDASLRLTDNQFMQALNMDFVEVGYSFLMTDEEEFDYESLYVFDFLQNKLTLRAQHTLFKKLHWSYSFSYQDRNGQYNDAETKTLKDYPDVFLINTRVSYDLPMLSVFVEGQNLLNRSYYDRGNVELPGAWLWCGARISL